MQQRRAWICVGRIWCCLQSHQVSVTMSLARQNHCLCLQLVASLSFPGPRQALVALLGSQQSLCVHSSDQAGIRPLALALAVHWQPLWRGQLNLHSRSQPPTLGGIGKFLIPSQTIQMVKEAKDPTCTLSLPSFTMQSCLYCHGQAFPHMMVRRPVCGADTQKSSKWREWHKSTLNSDFLTSYYLEPLYSNTNTSITL